MKTRFLLLHLEVLIDNHTIYKQIYSATHDLTFEKCCRIANLTLIEIIIIMVLSVTFITYLSRLANLAL